MDRKANQSAVDARFWRIVEANWTRTIVHVVGGSTTIEWAPIRAAQRGA